MKNTNLEAREQAEPMYTLTLTSDEQEYLFNVIVQKSGSQSSPIVHAWRHQVNVVDMEARKLTKLQGGWKAPASYDLVLPSSELNYLFGDVFTDATRSADDNQEWDMVDKFRSTSIEWQGRVISQGYMYGRKTL